MLACPSVALLSGLCLGGSAQAGLSLPGSGQTPRGAPLSERPCACGAEEQPLIAALYWLGPEAQDPPSQSRGHVPGSCQLLSLHMNMASSRALSQARRWRGSWEQQGKGPCPSHPLLRQVSERAIHCPLVLGQGKVTIWEERGRAVSEAGA